MLIIKNIRPLGVDGYAIIFSSIVTSDILFSL